MQNYISDVKIGAGNFGQVQLVRHKRNGQVYVCKKVSLRGKNPAQVTEAHNEVKTMSKISHPNIVGFVEAFVEEETIHIIMEYADGKDLENFINNAILKNERIPEEVVLGYFVQMTLALRYLHGQHFLHRDLKAANVFLTSDGMVKLGDFGFSKQLTATLAVTSTICGTPYYFSPELCQKNPYNNRSDIWSLGVILYEMMALRKPFLARNMPELRHRVVTEPPTPFVKSPYTDDLEDLCFALLSKNPKERPSVEAILQTPVVKMFLLRMVERLSESEKLSTKEREEILSKHPKEAKEGLQKKASALATSGFQPGPKLKMSREEFMKMKANKEEPVPMQKGPEPDLHTETLHHHEVLDTITEVHHDTPIEVVGEITTLLLREEAARRMRHEVEEAIAATSVKDDKIFSESEDISGSVDVKAEENRLRGILGNARFDEAIQLIEQANASPNSDAPVTVRLEELMHGQFELVVDMQRLVLLRM